MESVAPYEVGIVAADVDTLVRFYTDVLAMTIYSDVTVPAAASRRTGLAPDGYRVVRLSTSAGQRFKIAHAPGTGRRSVDAAFPMAATGNFYVTFLVRDIEPLHARLREAGARLCSDGIVEVRPGVWLFLATDPEGNFLEFVEYADLASYVAPVVSR